MRSISIKRIKNMMRVVKACMFNKDIVINYQMGKVGSTTVSRYFRDKGYTEWHVHRFTDFYIHEKKRKMPILKILERLVLKFVLWRGCNIKIVCGYRDPLLRNISMFFETFNGVYVDKDIKLLEYSDLEELYKENFPHNSSIHWFNEEFNRILNIDIFKHPFNKEAGYCVIQKDNVEIFLYQIEKLNSLEAILRNFFNDYGYKIIRSNSAINKEYSDHYELFKSKYKVDDRTLLQMYNSKAVKYFYTEGQIQEMIQRWAKS